MQKNIPISESTKNLSIWQRQLLEELDALKKGTEQQAQAVQKQNQTINQLAQENQNQFNQILQNNQSLEDIENQTKKVPEWIANTKLNNQLINQINSHIEPTDENIPKNKAIKIESSEESTEPLRPLQNEQSSNSHRLFKNQQPTSKNNKLENQNISQKKSPSKIK